MNFAEAYTIMSTTWQPVRRRGWVSNCIYIEPGIIDVSSVVDKNGNLPSHIFGIPIQMFLPGPSGVAVRLPNFCMAFKNGPHVQGFSPNSIDMMSDDWEVCDLMEDSGFGKISPN